MTALLGSSKTARASRRAKVRLPLWQGRRAHWLRRWQRRLCVACAAGKFKDAANDRLCSDCARAIPPVSWCHQCKDCAFGRFHDGVGETQCKACNSICDAGYSHSGWGASKGTQAVCTGSFKPARNDQPCEACTSGYFQDAAGATSTCKPCASGKYASSEGRPRARSVRATALPDSRHRLRRRRSWHLHFVPTGPVQGNGRRLVVRPVCCRSLRAECG